MSLWPDLWFCPLPGRSSAVLPTAGEPCPHAAAHVTISFALVADGHSPSCSLNPAGWWWFEVSFAGSCPESAAALAVAAGGRRHHRRHRGHKVKSGSHDQATAHSAFQRGRRCRLGPGGGCRMIHPTVRGKTCFLTEHSYSSSSLCITWWIQLKTNITSNTNFH